MTVFLIHKQQTNLSMKLPTVGKIVKYRLLSAEPIRLQDFEDSARSQAWKKIYYKIYCSSFIDFTSQFTSLFFFEGDYSFYSQARSSVPPKIPLMNLLFESWVRWQL